MDFPVENEESQPQVHFENNSENYHFVNHLCVYLKYINIPELFRNEVLPPTFKFKAIWHLSINSTVLENFFS